MEGNEDEESYIKTKEGMKGVFQCYFILKIFFLELSFRFE